ncbi:MAG: transposase [Candidatus Eremiobacteraeota bacterium]|nr:transposase [Candidatus Eremiobacteraeota bacterium]MCW5866261.1 transposase [Candidatus Eremiobacteraeota bacterium]
MSQGQTDYDLHWKIAITQYFRAFLEFFFPRIAAEIDWGRAWAPLDKELLPGRGDDEVGAREADLLFRVYRNTGEESWVLIHLEIQATRQALQVFEERVWVYAARTRLRYHRKVCSLAILADLSPSWRPHCFLEELWGCRMSLSFPTVKLLDLEKTLGPLSDNPFSWIVRFHLAAKRSKAGGVQRRSYKRAYLLAFWRAVRQGLLDRKDVNKLRTIENMIDGLLSLSHENDKLFRKELERDEEIGQMKKQMPRLTMFERWAREDALEEGRRWAEQERQRADEERQRAERFAQKLRELGVDPGSL